MKTNFSNCARSGLGNEKLTYTIQPKYLKVENEENPGFFGMVEYYYQKAIEKLYPKLVLSMRNRMTELSEKERIDRLLGIVDIMASCSNVMQVSFPIKMDCGRYEIITGYRIHHSQHRSPVKGGSYYLFNKNLWIYFDKPKPIEYSSSSPH